MIEYDGAAYRGFQWQPQLPTIQGVLREGVQRITGKPTAVNGASRTDSGAHAAGQVVSFDLDSRLDDGTLLRALNAVLPRDIAIQSLKTVGNDFDPRRQASRREYHYLVLNRPTRSPLWSGRALHVASELNVAEMRLGADQLVGTYDFSAFGSPSSVTPTNPDYPRTPVKTVFCFNIDSDGGLIRFRVVGSGFMHHMIRAMVGTLLLVGRDRMTPEEVRDVLASRDRSRAAAPVSPSGLYLMKVSYGDEVE